MNSLRKVIEGNVLAYNAPLKNVVKEMPIIILLRNCHPLDRGFYVYSLLQNKEISKSEAKEFVKIIGE